MTNKYTEFHFPKYALRAKQPIEVRYNNGTNIVFDKKEIADMLDFEFGEWYNTLEEFEMDLYAVVNYKWEKYTMDTNPTKEKNIRYKEILLGLFELIPTQWQDNIRREAEKP